MLKIWQKAQDLGVRSIPSRVRNHSGFLPWHTPSNRDFLVDYFSVGLDLIKKEDYVNALWIFSHLLELSPNDNQGARFIAIDCCLEIGKDLQAIEICDKYNKTHGPDGHLCFSKVLAMNSCFEEESIIEQIRYSIERFPKFAKLISQKRKKKFYGPEDFKSYGYISSELEEAKSFWNGQGEVWNRKPEIISLVREHYKEMKNNRYNYNRRKDVRK